MLKTFRLVRRRYPARVRIHIVMDNLSAHWTGYVLAWAEANNVKLVPTPTYASWLHLIEPQFGVMVKFVIAGSNYVSHAELQTASSAWLRRRNHKARRDFGRRLLERANRRARRAARMREAGLAPRARIIGLGMQIRSPPSNAGHAAAGPSAGAMAPAR